MGILSEGFFSGFGGVSNAPTLFARGAAEEALLWTAFGSGGSAGFVTESAGNAHYPGERVFAGTGLTYRAIPTARAVVMCGAMVKGLPLSTANIFEFVSSAPATIGSLRCTAVGDLVLNLVGPGDVATYAAGISQSSYNKIELAIDFTNTARFETRLNGARIPSMTTDNFTGDTGQPDGTVVRPTITTTACQRVEIGKNANHHYYWFWQKFGVTQATPWVRVTSGVSIGTLSDFPVGNKKYWTWPSTAGAYTINTATLGLGGNWKDENGSPAGVGTFPANIADSSTGMDSDTSYCLNSTNPGGAGGAPDILSWKNSDLPADVTAIGWVQVTTWAKAVSGTSTIRSGLRSPAAAGNPNFNFVDSVDQILTTGGYTPGGVTLAGSRTYHAMPYSMAGETPWLPQYVGIAGNSADRMQPFVRQDLLVP